MTTRQIQMMPRRLDVPWRKPDSSCVLNLSGQDQPDYGTTIYDRSGLGNHGTITGATWVKLPSGLWVLSFGTNKKVDCGTSTSLQFTTQDFTIEAWIYLTDMSSANTIISKGSWNVDGYFVQVQPGGNLFLATSQAGAGQDNYSQGGLITTLKWYHIAVVRSGVNAYFYINGVLRQGGLHNIINPAACTASLKVGVRTEGYQWMIGNIALLFVHNSALPVNTIVSRYNAQTHLLGI